MMSDLGAPVDALRTEAVLQYLERTKGTRCVGCAAPLCGHAAVMSLAMGFKTAPRCLACLARALEREQEDLRDHLYSYIEHQECYRAGWQWASRQEGFDPAVAPPCLWPVAVYADAPETSLGSGGMVAPGTSHVEWDAGDMGCGDLVLELRIRLQAMAPGQVLKVMARDLGAPQDLPAWCGLTGHTLLRADHPEYWIRRKEK